VLGFNVYRERDGRRLKLNRALIPAALAGTPPGRSYSFAVRRSPRGTRVAYWLQSVGIDGRSGWRRAAVTLSA
jgi:hypothetical protein